MPLSQILQSSRSNPPLNLRFRNALASNQGADSTFGLKTVPGPDVSVGRAIVDITGNAPIPSSAQGIMPWDFSNWRDGHAREWQFTIEREIMKNTALRLSYIGNHGGDLEQRFALNSQEAQFNYQARTGVLVPNPRDKLRANPNWSFDAENKTGYSNTNTLQAEIERRYSNGLAFQWFYVFTRSLTTTDAGGFTSGG